MNTQELLEQFKGKSILVVGDVILDEYIFGDVKRISPEAPVPVVEIKERINLPGGAANTAANVSALGGTVHLCGVVGDDIQAAMFRDEIKKHNIASDGIFIDDSRPTTIKTRIIARDQQITRVDGEKTHDLPKAIELEILEWVKEHLNQTAVCILSDYLKGVLSDSFTLQVIQDAKELKVPVVVDPKGKDFSKYAGSTLIKPNKFELEQVTNRHIDSEKELIDAGNELLGMMEGASLLVTRGSKGMSLFQDRKEPFHIPANTRTVYDVTGAGDTVISVMALAIASGASLAEAACLANTAAGIVVGKLGTATLTVDEVLEAVKE